MTNHVQIEFEPFNAEARFIELDEPVNIHIYGPGIWLCKECGSLVGDREAHLRSTHLRSTHGVGERDG